MSEQNLPGPVASTIQLIHEEESFFTTLSRSCVNILNHSGGDEITFNQRDGHGNITSRHHFMFLCAEEEKPGAEDFIQVQVEVESSTVTLIVRKDCLYLIGFSSSRGYFELKSKENEEDRLLPNATLLEKMGVNHHELLNIRRDDEANICTRFNHQQLITAVVALNEKDTREEELKHHLGTVILMILETTRFPNILKAIIDGGGMQLNDMIGQIKKWDNWSKILWNYRNEIGRVGDPCEYPLGELYKVEHAATLIKAVHRTQDRRLDEPAPTPTPSTRRMWNDTRKGESRGKKSKGESSGTKK